MKKLNKRQLTFAIEYAKDGDVTRASLVAGYTVRRGERLLEEEAVGTIIAQEKERYLIACMATPEEVLEFYTSLMRGQVMDDVVVKEKDETGQTVNQIMQKTAAANVRLGAAKQLALRFGLNLREGMTGNPMEGFFDSLDEEDEYEEDMEDVY